MRQVNKERKLLSSVKAILYTRINRLAFDLIITESSIYSRDFSDIYKAQDTDAFLTQENIL